MGHTRAVVMPGQIMYDAEGLGIRQLVIKAQGPGEGRKFFWLIYWDDSAMPSSLMREIAFQMAVFSTLNPKSG